MSTKHQMNWEEAACLDFAANYQERMFLESWYTKSDNNSINICLDMAGAYYKTRVSKLANFQLTQVSNGKLFSFIAFDNGFHRGDRNVRQKSI